MHRTFLSCNPQIVPTFRSVPLQFTWNTSLVWASAMYILRAGASIQSPLGHLTPSEMSTVRRNPSRPARSKVDWFTSVQYTYLGSYEVFESSAWSSLQCSRSCLWLTLYSYRFIISLDPCVFIQLISAMQFKLRFHSFTNVDINQDQLNSIPNLLLNHERHFLSFIPIIQILLPRPSIPRIQKPFNNNRKNLWVLAMRMNNV